MDPGRADERRGALDAEDPASRVVGEPVETGSAWELLRRAEPPLAAWIAPDGALAVGAGAADEVVTEGTDRLARVRDHLADRYASLSYDGPAQASPRFFGGMRFTSGTASSERWSDFPDSWFFLPRLQVIEQAGDAWLTTVGDAEFPPARRAETDGRIPRRIAETAVPSREGWLDQVERARAEIHEERYEKVVLAHTLELELERPPSPVPLLRELQRTNPSCFVTMVQPSDEALFVAATPERLVTRSGSSVRTDALAGSAERGTTESADDRLSSALAESEKDRLEHDLVVRAITGSLAEFDGHVEVGDRRVEQLRSVQHLHTPIRASYRDPPHVLELVESLHPTPAVGGLPRDPALSAIRRLESIDRGWYAAPIGWVDGRGDGSFAVGIRSAVVRGSNADLFAGAGIVGDSVPDAEWDELHLKYQPLLDTFEQA